MLPIKLTIQGLYSYQQAQVIDFSRLMEASLFGIFGGVGSGKSSILEAIAIAVYNETERMHQRDNKTYNMMNLKSDTLLIDFEFQNFEGEIYRAKVEGKRHKSRFEDVPAFKRSMYVRKQNEWIPIEKNGDEIVGMSYDNFRRTIIIPQGKFQEFLQLGDKDRTKMMEELFQLHRFDFSNKTAMLEKKNNRELDQLKGQFETYKALNDEQREELKLKVTSLKKDYELISSQVTNLLKQVTEAGQLQELIRKLEQKKSAFDELQKRLPDIQKLEQEINRYETAVNKFGSLLENLRKAKNDLQHVQLRIVQTQMEVEQLQQKLQTLKVKKVELQPLYDSIEATQARIRLLENVAKAKELEAEIIPKEGELANLQESLQSKETQLLQKQLKVEDLKQAIKSTRESMPDYTVIAAVNSWWTEFDRLEKEFKQEQDKLEKHESNLKSFPLETQNQLELAIGRSISADKEVLELEDLLTYVINAEYTSKDRLEKLAETLSKYEQKEWLAGIAGTLTPGESCPVCGAVEHPHILVSEDISRDLSAQKNAIREEQEYAKKLLQAIGHLKSAKTTYENLKTETAGKKLAIDKLRKQKEAHQAAFAFSGYALNDREKSAQDVEQYKALNKKQQDLEASLEKLEKEAKKEHAKADDMRGDRLRLQQEVQEKRTRIAALTEEVGANLLQAYREMEVSEIRRIAAAEEQKISTTKRDYEATRDQINSETQALSGKTATEANLNEQLEALEKSQVELKEKLAQSLKDSEFESLAEVESLLNTNPDLQLLKKQVEAFHTDLTRTTAELEMLQQEVGDKTFDQAAFEELKEMLKRFQDQERDILSKLSKHEQDLERLEKDLKIKAELEVKLKKLETRAANIRTLKLMFAGKGFVNFISGGYLQQLCQAANERFHQLTRQQLSLELNDKLNFIVRDFLHNGHTRSVKTLSGGQTFQASLSLALALAGSIRQQHKADQNFFFLDEGFGALDKDSLQTVFHTIKSLRDERRAVGLISHVEELQQEIDVFLKIVNDPETGSRVDV